MVLLIVDAMPEHDVHLIHDVWLGFMKTQARWMASRVDMFGYVLDPSQCIANVRTTYHLLLA